MISVVLIASALGMADAPINGLSEEIAPPNPRLASDDAGAVTGTH